jgi:hypothetical protein
MGKAGRVEYQTREIWTRYPHCPRHQLGGIEHFVFAKERAYISAKKGSLVMMY